MFEKQNPTEIEEIIRILFDICVDKIDTFFESGKLEMIVFKSERIKNAVECLEYLESEVLTFYSALNA